jgi:ATP-dependent 26S proteasome regulatory subunit
MYKRGICLWGPPGSGKTCTVQLIVKDVTENRDGICVIFSHPRLFLSGMRILRQIHPDKKVVVLMEDLDSIIEQHDESEVLNILDGVNAFEDVVFLATTNYPEKLGHRIINRPSRFDKRIKIDFPNEECREIYLNTLLTKQEIKENKIDIKKWVEDTMGFSMAHLKELFVAHVILGDEYEEALNNLKRMKSHISSEDSGGKMGFTEK